ncbi:MULTISPECIES: nucleotidyltransferase-like protein [unclassified Paenibacillus]|uniref:nucleotidyltransferase-like protein n=1 Tax=unclassified Paenibacillus TaxID=185978 RepID=UPI002F4003C0
MEIIKKHLIDAYRVNSNVASLILVPSPISSRPLIEGTNALVIVVQHKAADDSSLEHVIVRQQKVVIMTLSKAELCSRLQSGIEVNSSVMEWLVRGEILLDTDAYWANTRKEVLSFPENLREMRCFKEFSLFLQTYMQAKQFLNDGHVLDAYSNILQALHHWAHIVLIEEGIRPELTVWKQLRRVHPGVYKLYEELSASPETIEQRVQLVMLACEFTVMNKMKTSCEFLFKIMREQEEPWSMSQLQGHPKLEPMQIELSLVIQKLVTRSYIEEVAVMSSAKEDWMELCYKVGE